MLLGHQQACDELYEVWQDCLAPDWDGNGASPVVRLAYCETKNLIESLPPGFPRPSIGAEPDGQMTLEWRRQTRRVLSVSVDPTGVLHYAAMYGSDVVNGTIEYFGGQVPDKLIQLVNRL